MDKPTLELAPYEIELERRPDRDGAPFEFRALWFGSEREFVGQVMSSDQHGFHLWFSLADEPERGNFVCSSKPRSERLPYAPYTEFWTHQHPQQFVESAQNELWGRLFVLDSQLQLADGTNGCCTVFLAASGWGRVGFINYRSAEFQWSAPCAKALAEPDSIRYVEEVTTLAQTPYHPFHFAFEWATLSKIQRLTIALPLHGGDYAQWEHVIRLYATATLKHDEGWLSHHEICLVSGGPCMQINVRYHWQRQLEVRREENHRCQNFLSWTLAYFRPTRNEELCTNHPCVRFYAESKTLLFSGFVEQGTQHERLEALLQLREWMADKATPEEIEWLLSEG